MATKKKIVKTDTDMNTKILKVLGDVAFIAVMASFTITMLILALSIAQKITITVGK